MIDGMKLQEIFLDCLFKEEELEHVDGKTLVKGDIKPVPAMGVVNNVAFHPDRLQSHHDEVKEMFNQLSPQFQEGLSFIQMPMDKDGNQWGEQRSAEQLMLLGIGLKYVTLPMPRPLWGLCPGGVPFVIVDFNKMNGKVGEA